MNDWKKESISLPSVKLFEANAKPTEEPHRRWWIWVVYLLLFGASIPWYLPKDSAPQIWFGLPHWVIISLVATIGIALFTAFVVHRYWRDAESPARFTDEGDKQP